MFPGLGSIKVFSKAASEHHDTCIKDSAVPGPGASLYEEKSASDLQMDMSVPLLEASSWNMKHFTITSDIHTNRRRCLLHTGVKDVRAVGQLGCGETMWVSIESCRWPIVREPCHNNVTCHASCNAVTRSAQRAGRNQKEVSRKNLQLFIVSCEPAEYFILMLDNLHNSWLSTESTRFCLHCLSIQFI